jgi:CO/xanthine dehydrogenase Mo-binding subunit
MPEFTLRINCQKPKVNLAPDTPQLGMIGETLNLAGTTFGCGETLYGSIKLENGRITKTKFGAYQHVREPAAPPIKAHLVRSSEAPTGIGEAPVPPFAAALCGATYAATRNRIRSLPRPPS